MEKFTKYFLWTLQIISAIILLQTLWFKFTAAPESVYIFTKLGIEPYGRIGSGIVELIAGIMLLFPRTAGVGALIAIGVMSGAILSHLTILGVEVMNDKGELFVLALIVFLSCLAISWLRRKEIPVLGKLFLN